MSATSALLTIDLNALAANYRTLSAEAEGAEVAPVVKADGYGLGAVETAKRLLTEGARTFFVARLDEGETLRRALGPDPTIFVLDGCPAGSAGKLAAARLTPVLNTLDQTLEWQGEAALMLDTGLNRLGVTAGEAETLRGRRFAYLMSHLACADEPGHPMNALQRERLIAAAGLFPDAKLSLAASDGLFLGRDYRLNLVRTGICLYGGGPHGTPDPRIRAVATLEAPVLQVRTLEPGEVAGYGAVFKAVRRTRLAVVALGYADGVIRASSPKAYAVFAGQACPMVGRVSMDLTLFDVTDLGEIRPGDMVQILGEAAPLDVFAKACGTIAYEVLTRLGSRAERRYLGRA